MKISIPATSANLGPGFDCLGLAVSFYNEVVITPSQIQSISIKGEGSKSFKLKKNNIFVSIFYETLETLIDKKPAMKFEFINNIPFSRGLGSSSAVIVSAIASAYKIAGFKVDKARVLNKALEYESHPDNIAPAVYGGFCASIVHNGQIYVQHKKLPPNLKALVVIPNSPTSTLKSRSKLPKKFPIKDLVFNLSHSSFLTACFLNEDWDMLKLAALDVVHEERRMKDVPELFKVREIANANKSLLSTLSGSGSSFLNIVYEKDANKLLKALQNDFPSFRVELFDFDNFGFNITQS